MHVMDAIQILMLGLVVGGIPFGVLVAKLFGLPDPRRVGSGNIGATNMLRTGNKRAALLTLLLDAAKGAVVVGVANSLFSIEEIDRFSTCLPNPCHVTILNPHCAALALLAAALGHMYSPYLKLKGGKGVATLFGGALVFSWPVAMASLCVWLIAVFTTRYVSLGSILALAVAPLVAWLRVDGTSALILGIASGFAIWKHRENIRRLLQGGEAKISLSKGNRP